MVNGLTNELLFVMYKTPERGGRILSFNVVPDVLDHYTCFKARTAVNLYLNKKLLPRITQNEKAVSYLRRHPL